MFLTKPVSKETLIKMLQTIWPGCMRTVVSLRDRALTLVEFRDVATFRV